MLQPRGAAAAPQRGGPARRTPSRRKPPSDATVPTSSITLPAGLDGTSTMQGRLSGSYNIVDSAWSKGGMLVLLHEGTAASRQFVHALQATLHFLSLAFCPPSLQRASTGNTGPPTEGGREAKGNRIIETAAEEVAIVFSFLRAQHPALFVRAVVGHGTAGDAALTYALRYGAAGACPVRRLVLIGAAHGNLDDAPSAGGEADARWEMLSVHGTADLEVPHMRAQLCNSRHRAAGGHALRLIQGAAHDFAGDEARVAATINDWLEGVRRLNSEDRSAWAVEARSAAAAADARAAAGGGKMMRGGDVDVEEDDLAFWGF
jgi:pimeloyl-ACP methyl ester carboxylesterase